MLTIFRPFGTSHLAPLVTAVPVGTHPRRKPSISARVGAVSGPRRVTLMAPAAFARAAASVHDRPDARSARSTPVCVSPAPLVSTGRRGWPGRYAVPPPLRTTHPRGPSRTIVTASGEILVATTEAVSSIPETPASAEASSALLVHTEVRARTASRVAGSTSAKVAPGSRTTTTPCGRVSSHSTRGSRVRPTREYPLTQTRSPAVGAAADSDWTVMWRSAPCVVTKDRSAVGSTSTTHTPVSRSGTGGEATSTPSARSAPRTRSPFGPVPTAPAWTHVAPERAAARRIVTAPPAYRRQEVALTLPPPAGTWGAFRTAI